MFNKILDFQKIQSMPSNNLGTHLGIDFLELGDDYILARMPVDDRTRQPFGILHGGASVVLAETLGSVGSWLLLEDSTKQSAVGLEINANHLRAVKSGWVYGKATAIHIGRKTHVWDVRIENEEKKPVCVCRLTVIIV
jgi:1,4-dihydroxy-2-naphthoyl-CoA hydrolase